MSTPNTQIKPKTATFNPTTGNKQKLPGHRATYSVRDAAKNGIKGAYVPPHMRSVTKNNNNNNKAEKTSQKEGNTARKQLNKKSNTNSNYRNKWRQHDDRADDRSNSNSNFRNWTKKEQHKREKKEPKEIIKPHCELFLTNLPPHMRNIGGLAAFFHPYGEVAQIQVIGINDEIPANVQKWCDVKQLVPKTHSAIVEFLTARTAKFVVGVLRKRLGQLTFNVGLIKPGLGEELNFQKNTYGEIVHQPSSNLTQQYIVTKTVISDTSSDSSEVETNKPYKRVIKRLVTANPARIDQAYWSQSSSQISSSDVSAVSSSESDYSDARAGSPISEAGSSCCKIPEDKPIDMITNKLALV